MGRRDGLRTLRNPVSADIKGVRIIAYLMRVLGLEYYFLESKFYFECLDTGGALASNPERREKRGLGNWVRTLVTDYSGET